MPSLTDLQDWAWTNRANLCVGVPALIFVAALATALLSKKMHPRWGWALLCFLYFDFNWTDRGERLTVGIPFGAAMVLLIYLFGPMKDAKPRRRPPAG